MGEAVGVVDGGSWIQGYIRRNSEGIEVFMRVDPKVEDFIKSISEKDLDKLSGFGSSWYGVPEGADPNIYRLIQDLSTPSYLFNGIGGQLMSGKAKQVNLSFLQFQGVGGEGARFSIPGPFGRDYIEDLSRHMLTASRDFIRNYIVPVGVRLTISTRELA